MYHVSLGKSREKVHANIGDVQVSADQIPGDRTGLRCPSPYRNMLKLIQQDNPLLGTTPYS